MTLNREISLKNILEGWGNWVLQNFKILGSEIEEMSKMRLLVCNICDIRNGNICSSELQGINIKTKEVKSGCGCRIPQKTLSPSSKCPLGKW